MFTHRSWQLLVALLIFCLCLAAIGTVGGSSGYELQADNAVDTPERSVTFDGTELTIDHIGLFDSSGSISATVSAPGDGHAVELRSATNPGPIIAAYSDGPQGSVSFDIADNQLAPGTYVVLVSESVFQQAVPVVVSGYDLSAEGTADTSTDELTISTTVTPTASSGQPHAVQAVVWNTDTQKRVTLAQQSGNQYTETVSVAEFDDSYEVYVTAVGDEALYNNDGENEILGLSEADVVESTGSDDDDSGSGSTDGGGGGQLPADESSQPPNEGVNTNESTGTNTTVEGNETERSDNSTVVNGNETDLTNTSGGGTESSADDETVIQPNNGSSTNNTSDQTDDETPLSPGLTVVALLSAALVAARRQ